MPVYYRYDNAILGTQSNDNGASIDYGNGPAFGSSWTWSGDTTPFGLREVDGATQYNGDGFGASNEVIAPQERIGGVWEQVTRVDGTYYQTIWDYTFEITDNNGNFYTVAVIDVDFDTSNVIDVGEDGYYLIFPDGVPPAGGDYTVLGIVENDARTPHAGLGARIVCFASGTLIEAETGLSPIETLRPGDKVATQDNGLQTLRWIGRRRIQFGDVGDNSQQKLRPIRIIAGALGDGLPKRDLLVSRQHRMLVRSKIAQRMFGTDEVLIPAIKLTSLPGVFIDETIAEVEYVHMLFDQHEIVFAEGSASESLFTGPEALKSVDEAARAEIFSLFPELATRDYSPEPARYIPPGKRQIRLVNRHRKNGKALQQ